MGEAEDLKAKMKNATAFEKAAVKQSAEDLKASMEKIKAAEMGVLESREAEFRNISANMEAAMEEKAEKLEAELKELEDDLKKVHWETKIALMNVGPATETTELMMNPLFDAVVTPHPKKMSLITTIAYSTAFVFLVAAFIAAALYEPKKSKTMEMPEVVIDIDAKPAQQKQSKKAIKKTLKSIMKNNNTKVSLMQ